MSKNSYETHLDESTYVYMAAVWYVVKKYNTLL